MLIHVFISFLKDVCYIGYFCNYAVIFLEHTWMQISKVQSMYKTIYAQSL